LIRAEHAFECINRGKDDFGELAARAIPNLRGKNVFEFMRISLSFEKPHAAESPLSV